MTEDGKYIRESDNKTFNTREDYDKHCSGSHTKTGKIKSGKAC